MAHVLAPLAALLFGCTLLVLGQGFFLVLIPLALNETGFSSQAVGLVVTAYFAGFGFGAWFSSRLISSVGHVRTYGGLIAIVLVAILSLSLTQGAGAWALLRFIHGAAVSGVFVTVESWLTSACPGHWRGRVLGTYTFLSLGALGSGQLFLNVYGTAGFEPFNFGAILFALSIIPVVLSKVSAPPVPPVTIRLNWKLARTIPVGLAVAGAGGLLTGSFWAAAPLFAASIFQGTSAITFLIGLALLGGVLLQYPVGYLSDRQDRRRVILWVAILGVVAASATIFVNGRFPGLVNACMLVYGGVIFTFHPLALAHAADHASTNEEMLSISQGLLLTNGIGLAMGPMLVGFVTRFAGRDGLFVFVLGILGAVAVAIIWRMRHHAPVPKEERGTYVASVQTTPAQLKLDSRLDASIEATNDEKI